MAKNVYSYEKRKKELDKKKKKEKKRKYKLERKMNKKGMDGLQTDNPENSEQEKNENHTLEH